MWIGDKVKIMEAKKVKKGKVKLKTKCVGKIKKHAGQIGLADETSVFLIECEDGTIIEESEDFLKLIKD